MSLVKNFDSKTQMFGFLDSSGAIIVPHVYVATGEWSEGLIYVKRSGWRGFLNENADEVISLNGYSETAELPVFCNGVCVVSCVKPDGRIAKGCIDKSGAIVIPVENEFCRALSDSIFIIIKNDCRYLRLKDGFSIEISEYLSIGAITAGRYITVSKEGKYGVEKWGCIDFHGQLVIPNLYDSISVSPSEQLTVRNGNRFGIIDLKGNEITGLIYSQAMCFQNGRCAVGIDNKWGFIDVNGKVIVPIAYLCVIDTGKIILVMHNDRTWSILNGDGRTISKSRYQEVKQFSEGRCAVKDLNGWGFIDEDGTVCIPCQFSEVGIYSGGTCKVKRKGLVTGNDNPWGEIDKDGNFIKMWENNNAENISKKVEEAFWNVGKAIHILKKILR